VKADVEISMIEFNQATTEDHVIDSVFTTSEVMLSSQSRRSSDDSSELLSQSRIHDEDSHSFNIALDI